MPHEVKGCLVDYLVLGEKKSTITRKEDWPPARACNRRHSNGPASPFAIRARSFRGAKAPAGESFQQIFTMLKERWMFSIDPFVNGW